MDIAAIKVKWFDNEMLGRRAEAQAILDGAPKYNLRMIHPDAVGYWKMRSAERQPRSRGDGLHCPKCGELKRKRTDAYCHPCYNRYQREMKRRRQAAKDQNT
jgi:hypothetical protein